MRAKTENFQEKYGQNRPGVSRYIARNYRTGQISAGPIFAGKASAIIFPGL
jgi:hypothetical protein